jgi:hypothetical protein
LRTIPDSQVFLMEDRTGCFPCAGPGRKHAKLNNRYTRFNLIFSSGRGGLKRLTFRRVSDDVTGVTEKSTGLVQNRNRNVQQTLVENWGELPRWCKQG